MTTKTFALPRAIKLNVRMGYGSLCVRSTDNLTEATVALTARSDRSDIVERTVVGLQGDTLVVTSPRQGGIFEMFTRGRDAIDIEIDVPTDTPANISCVSADITVEGRCGRADIAAGAAHISIAEVAGDLRLRYGSGTSTVGPVRGSVQVRSGSGTAAFGEVSGSLTSACGSGALEVAAVRGHTRSRAGSGGATVRAAYGDVDLGSGSGELAIGVPEGVRARVDITTGSGRVDSELPISDSPSSTGAKITVRARTGSGDIRLFRANAA
jgi:hypothetical protein